MVARRLVYYIRSICCAILALYRHGISGDRRREPLWMAPVGRGRMARPNETLQKRHNCPRHNPLSLRFLWRPCLDQRPRRRRPALGIRLVLLGCRQLVGRWEHGQVQSVSLAGRSIPHGRARWRTDKRYHRRTLRRLLLERAACSSQECAVARHGKALRHEHEPARCSSQKCAADCNR